MKKTKGIVITMYIVAGVMAAAAIYLLIYNIQYLVSYASSYGMSLSDMGGQAVSYVLTAALPYFAYAAILFGIGKGIAVLASAHKAEEPAPIAAPAPSAFVEEEMIPEAKAEAVEEAIEETIVAEETAE